jgi:thymidylate kinase
MGIRNYLIEGVSCTGKTTVCHELRERGYHAINGDTDLAYQGDPASGEPIAGHAHEHHIWDVGKVKALVADKTHDTSFFCGGLRNFTQFIQLFDRVFILEIDLDTLNWRLAGRPEDEWGGKPAERQLVRRLHATGEDLPKGAVPIDATAPLQCVVDEILVECVQD